MVFDFGFPINRLIDWSDFDIHRFGPFNLFGERSIAVTIGGCEHARHLPLAMIYNPTKSPVHHHSITILSP